MIKVYYVKLYYNIVEFYLDKYINQSLYNWCVSYNEMNNRIISNVGYFKDYIKICYIEEQKYSNEIFNIAKFKTKLTSSKVK